MNNKEKYAKEIIDIACSGHAVSVSKVTGKPIACENNSCKNCVRHNVDLICCEEKRLKEWAESEYIEKPVISKRDKAFLEYIDGKFKYIVRDSVGELYAYSAKPCKDLGIWAPQTGVGFQLDFNFSVDFKVVKWSDEEPWLIEDLKKLEVVDEYE